MGRQEAIDALIDVVRRTRDMVALPDNDFMWSSWSDAADGVEELDGILAELMAGDVSSLFTLGVLFAPTGPIQEVSVSSGWGQAFLELAGEFDAAVGRL